MSRHAFFLPDDAATASLGTMLASLLRSGDNVLLRGELGAGKTALARAIIRTLTNDPALEVPSPSFALVQPYEAGDLSIIHADLYRLADAGEIDELGLSDDPDAIVLIEWPERAPQLADKATIIIDLMLGENGNGRTVEIMCTDADRDLAAGAKQAKLIPVPVR